MLRLQLLGGAAVIGDAGEALGGAASQRRILALLAALAAAGDAGLSRDKLVGLLWPETESERARHSLTQAIYAARRALGRDDVFVINADIRLQTARITSDLAEFDSALRQGSLESAAALYRGPFLDGFFLPGCAEFEQWVSTQRERVDSRLLEALQQLATHAESTGDAGRAAEWWRRAAVLRPLNSGIAIQLMMNLAAAGDRAGALQHARVHEMMLREQLDIGVDLEVTQLTRRLRDGGSVSERAVSSRAVLGTSASHTDATSGQSANPRASIDRVPGVFGDASNGVEVPRDTPAVDIDMSARDAVTIWVPARRRAILRPSLAALGAAAVLIALGVVVGREWRSTRVIQRLHTPQRVVVAPFRVVGASASLSYLREGIVELLSTRLTDDSSARSVDAGAVLGAWRAAGLAAAMDVARDTVVEIARRLGAERVVVGSIVGTPTRLIIRATVLRAPGGALAGEATVEGPADSLTALVDRLAASLLVAQAGEDEPFSSHTTESLPALRAFLDGQAAFRRSDYTLALRAYATAVRRDSAFALAALRLAITGDRLNDVEQTTRAAALAVAARARLGERDGAMLTALVGPRYPAISPALEQFSGWQRVVELAPQSAESWYTLGARLFHEGAVLGIPAWEDRARTALERALAVDSNYAAAARLLIQLASRAPGSGGVDSLGLTAALRDSLSPFAPFLRWRMAVARGDTVVQNSMRQQFGRMGPANLRAIAMTSQFDVTALRDGARAIEILRSRPTTSSRTEVLLAEHSHALNAGRRGDALEATVRLRGMLPGSNAYLRLRVLDALYGNGDTTAARVAAGRLEEITSSGVAATVGTSATWAADRCVVAQWRLAHGDTTGAQRTVAELQGYVGLTDLPIAAAAPSACAAILRTWAAVVLKQPEAVALIAGLDSLAFTPQVTADAVAYTPLLLARLHERLGDTPGALRAVRKRLYMSGWPRYHASSLRLEGSLAATTGDTAGAREAYQGFLAFRQNPDPEFGPEVDEVSRALLSLTLPGTP